MENGHNRDMGSHFLWGDGKVTSEVIEAMMRVRTKHVSDG